MSRQFAARAARLMAFALVIAGSPAVTTAEPAAGALNARDAGARYGQALGAIEICIGTKTTDKLAALLASYSGDEQQVFKDQAAKVFEAWVKVKNCKRQDDPNQCKIIMDRSCESALAEIGPAGTSIPGLITPPAK